MELIYGNLDEKLNKYNEIKNRKYNIYYKLYLSNLKKQNYHIATFYGIKYIVLTKVNKELTYEQCQDLLDNAFLIDTCMSHLTYSDFINIFPIDKTFDGDKYDSKDYYSTMDYLNNRDLNEIIGDEVDDLLDNYYNSHIINYCVKKYLLFDRMRKIDGKLSLIEEFLKEYNLDVDTYSVNDKKGYIINNNTGEISKLKKTKTRPKYLKIIK